MPYTFRESTFHACSFQSVPQAFSTVNIIWTYTQSSCSFQNLNSEMQLRRLQNNTSRTTFFRQWTYLLKITFFCSSWRSNVARAHRPPYIATLLGDNSSGKSQWSKFATRKCFAADLYFLVANSAKPAAHLSRVWIVWLLSLACN